MIEQYIYIGPDTILQEFELKNKSIQKISTIYKTRLIKKSEYNGKHPIREAYDLNNIVKENHFSISQDESNEYLSSGFGIGVILSDKEFKNYTEKLLSILTKEKSISISDLEWFKENFITLQESRENIIDSLI